VLQYALSLLLNGLQVKMHIYYSGHTVKTVRW